MQVAHLNGSRAKFSSPAPCVALEPELWPLMLHLCRESVWRAWPGYEADAQVGGTSFRDFMCHTELLLSMGGEWKTLKGLHRATALINSPFVKNHSAAE